MDLPLARGPDLFDGDNPLLSIKLVYLSRIHTRELWGETGLFARGGTPLTVHVGAFVEGEVAQYVTLSQVFEYMRTTDDKYRGCNGEYWWRTFSF